MRTTTTTGRVSLLLAGLLLLAACKLTSTEVVPDLPSGRVENTATLAYRANGQAIVANNALNVGRVLVGVLGGGLPITAKLRADSTLSIFATDVNNLPDKPPYRTLQIEIRRFHGTGTYTLDTGRTAGTDYYVTTYDSNGHPVSHADQTPVAGTLNQVVITSWSPVAKVLQGNFVLHVAGPNNPQAPTELSDGRFDLDVQ